MHNHRTFTMLLMTTSCVAAVALAACSADDLEGAPIGSAVTTTTSGLVTTTTTTSPVTTTTVAAAVEPAAKPAVRAGQAEAFWVQPSSVTLLRYDDGSMQALYGGFIGIRKQSLEFAVRRPRYSQPLQSELLRRRASDEETVAVEGIALTWDGFQEVGSIVVRDATGEDVAVSTLSWCPQSLVRVDRGTELLQSQSSYCGASNALQLGTVWELDDGWGSAVEVVDLIDLPVGEFTATIELDADLARLLKMAERTIEVDIVVEAAPPGETLFGQDPFFTDPFFEEPFIQDPLVDSPFVTLPADVFPVAEDPFATDASPTGETLPPAPVDPADSPIDDGPAHNVTPVDPADLPDDPAALPDLRALPASGIRVYQASDGREYLGYGATVWNAGPGPLVIEGYRGDEPDLMAAVQQFVVDGRIVGDVEIGTMEYHRAEHNHWHFFDFARYELTDASRTVVERSAKQSWCLVATDAVDMTLKNAARDVKAQSLSSSCGGESDIWIREALPVGWGDTYSAGYVGQDFDITDLANGTYYIKVTPNPFGAIAEVAEATSDISYRRVELVGAPGSRAVVVPPHQGIDTEFTFEGF